MPTVPTQKIRTVAPIADQGRFQNAGAATADAFGAATAQATTQLGGNIDAVAQTAVQIQIENNAREAKELDVEYTERRRQLLYGDGTPQNPGFFSTRGANAVEASPVIQEQLEEIRQEIIGKSSNGQVGRLFDETSTRRS